MDQTVVIHPTETTVIFQEIIEDMMIGGRMPMEAIRSIEIGGTIW